MKKVLITVFVLINIHLYSFEPPKIYHGLSLGNISFNYSPINGASTFDLFSYRFIEANTGLGLTTYVWPMVINWDSQETSIISSNDLFAMELNWEPLFDPYSDVGLGVFGRIDNYFPTDNDIDFRVGGRVELRQTFGEILYPIIGLECGYWSHRGPYLGIKMDPVVLVTAAIFAFAEYTREQYPVDYYPDEYVPNRTPNNEEPDFKWMPEPEV